MKIALVLLVSLVATAAFAEDFEGTWKVPDSPTQTPSKQNVQKSVSAIAGIDSDIRRPLLLVAARADELADWLNK